MDTFKLSIFLIEIKRYVITFSVAITEEQKKKKNLKNFFNHFAIKYRFLIPDAIFKRTLYRVYENSYSRLQFFSSFLFQRL